MHILVDKPVVDGDTILFSWQQDVPNHVQFANEFLFGYEGLALEKVHPVIWDELFLALQLGIWKSHYGTVEVRFAEPVNSGSVTFWKAFHRADNVLVHPLTENKPGQLWQSSEPSTGGQFKALVLFGGGKDSMMAAQLLREQFGQDEVLLVNEAAPSSRSSDRIARMTKRQEDLSLRPARELLGMSTRSVWTDFIANIKPEHLKKHRPHYLHFTVGCLPLAVASDARFVTISLAWSNFYKTVSPDGTALWANIRSRPEMQVALNSHIQHHLGFDLKHINPNLFAHESLAYRVLAERYPEAYRRIVSCHMSRPPSRFCYKCRKCFRFAFKSLATGTLDPEFNYNRAIRDSPQFNAIIALAEHGIDLANNGNVPYQPNLFGAPWFDLECNTIWQINPEVRSKLLDRESRQRLHITRALFGNRPFPELDVVPENVIRHLPAEISSFAGGVVSKSSKWGPAPIIDHPDGSGSRIEFDFEHRPPHRLFAPAASVLPA